MITAGIDMGSRSIKIVLLEDIQVEGAPQMKYAQKKPYLMLPGDMDADQAATIAFDNACREAGVDKDSVTRIYATGAGRKQAAFTKEWANQSGREVHQARNCGAPASLSDVAAGLICLSLPLLSSCRDSRHRSAYLARPFRSFVAGKWCTKRHFIQNRPQRCGIGAVSARAKIRFGGQRGNLLGHGAHDELVDRHAVQVGHLLEVALNGIGQGQIQSSHCGSFNMTFGVTTSMPNRNA